LLLHLADGSQHQNGENAAENVLHENNTDVFIIGGGPAGLAAAIAATQIGFSVTVADGAAPPIDKSCGEGLLPEGVRALRELGVCFGSNDFSPLRGIRFNDEFSSVKGDFGAAYAAGIRRTVLHARMIERAEACGVRLLWQTPVNHVTGNVVWHGESATRARWIVGADGAGSRVRKWSGLDRGRAESSRFAYRRHFRVAPWSEYIEVFWTPDGQIYVTPVSRQEISVAIVSRREPLRIEQAIKRVPDLAERLRDAEPASAERGAVTTLRRFARVTRGSVALIGDASGSTDAVTGQGLCVAFEQALALANAFAANDLALYERAHRRIARKPRCMARLLLLLDRHAVGRRRVMQAFAREPRIFEQMLAAHAGANSPALIASAGLSLGWRVLTA
jgi:flavin-dependent dehydrogenase